MSGAQSQLANFGSRYRSALLPVPQLSLDPAFTTSQLGWCVQTGNCQVFNMTLTLPTGDDGLQNALGTLSQASRGKAAANPQAAVPSFLQSLSPSDWDTLYGLARQIGPSTWTDIPGAQTNIANGKPVSIGKIDGGGNVVPTSADGVIAGFGLPLPAISAGKRYPFASGLDVHLYVYVDKDAFARDMKLLPAGGGIGFETKTSDGTKLKLRIGAGRDQAGGAAGFIRLQIGPDYVAAPGGVN